MRMSKILSLLLVFVMLASCFVACGPKDEGTEGGGSKETEKETITIWISEKTGVDELTKVQVARFMEANPQYSNYEIKVEGVSESDAASQVLLDPSSSADIYGFAQDQLARLVQASALASPGVKATETITSANDAGSVQASTVGDKLYAYPMTSDNGYFLYYDKSVVKNPSDLQSIVDDCKNAGLKFNFELENGWYTASFFFGVGCHSTWTTNDEGDFISYDDNFSDNTLGTIAMKGLQIVTTEIDVYNSSSKIEDKIGAVVTGTWNAVDAEAYFGENLGIAKLPTFTVDGTTYQLGSFSGFKLMGVKPQPSDKPERAALCNELALYLTSEECQLERFNRFQWGPSNKNLQELDAVKNNESLIALKAQNEHAVAQGNIPNAWWTSAANLGKKSNTCANDAEIKIALDAYKAELQEIVNKE